MKTALVTGGGSGIGLATTEALEHAGYRVLTVARRPAARGQDHFRADLGGEPEAVCAIGAWATERLGEGHETTGQPPELDLLVNNAASSHKCELADVTLDMFDRLTAVNMRAPLFLIQQFSPLLAGSGSVVTVSSIRGQRGFAGDVVYQMAKGALEAMTRALAVELADQGIRVNAVAPGATATPMNREVQREHLLVGTHLVRDNRV